MKSTHDSTTYQRRWRIFVLTLACAAVLCGCGQRVARPPAPEEDALPLGFPTEALSPDTIRQWWQERADPRDGSLDLEGPVLYVESRIQGSDGGIDRVGFFVDRQSWEVDALLMFLSDTAPLRRALLPIDEHLWGRPLYTTEAPDTFAVGSEGCVNDPRRPGCADDATASRLVLWKRRTSASLPAAPRVIGPTTIPMKTDVATFHRDHLFALVDGRIFFKENPSRAGARDEPWRLFLEGTPRPHRPRDVDAAPFRRPAAIVALRADGDELVAVDETGFVYTCTAESQSWGSESGWTDGWGFPGKRPMSLLDRAPPIRDFAYGRRAEHALWFEDAIGNRQHMGPMGTSTLYALSADGRQLFFTDNGLPNDLSRELCLPDEGRFTATAVSASASALMLIDRFGRVMTRFDDYDLNGGTPNFEYTYRSEVRVDDDPTSMSSSVKPYFLPLPPWTWQPPLPTGGRARISSMITILQTGIGNAARVLRVVGDDNDGRRGFFTKAIEDDAWSFVVDPTLVVPEDRWLAPDDVIAGMRDFLATSGEVQASALPRGPDRRERWHGTLAGLVDDARAPLPSVSVSLDFHPACSPHRLTLHIPKPGPIGAVIEDVRPDDVIDVPVTLHTVDFWTPAQRSRPGFDGTSLLQLGTLVFDDAVLTDRRAPVRRVVRALRAFHHDTFGLLVAHNHVRFVSSSPHERDSKNATIHIRVVDEDRAAAHPMVLHFERAEPPATAPPQPWRARPMDLAFFLDDAREAILTDAALLESTRTGRARRKALRAALMTALDELRRPEREMAALQESALRLFVPVMRVGRVPRLPRLLQLAVEEDAARVREAERRIQAIVDALARLDIEASAATEGNDG
jgi:hypothetical protein